MAITKLKLYLVIGSLLLSGAGYALWRIHDALAESRVRTAIELSNVKHRAEEADRIAAATEYQTEIDTLTSRNRRLTAQVRMYVQDNPDCAWGVGPVRLLNAARGHVPAPAGQPPRAVPGAAETDGAAPAR